MPFLIGAALALGVGAFAALVGFDRERSFYPVVLIVVAGLYVLFAVMGGAGHALLVEAAIMAGFVALAVAGFKGSPWLVVAGLAGHGMMDLFHPHLVANPGAPAWWPMFCSAYDLAAAVWLAALLVPARRKAREATA